MRPTVRVFPRGLWISEAIGVVVELAATDVFVRKIAADEALLLFGAGNPSDAAERRQIEEPFVVGRRVFPDQQCGAFDVVGAEKAHQDAVASGRITSQPEHDQRALAHALLAIEQASSSSPGASHDRCRARRSDWRPIRRFRAGRLRAQGLAVKRKDDESRMSWAARMTMGRLCETFHKIASAAGSGSPRRFSAVFFTTVRANRTLAMTDEILIFGKDT